MRITQKATDFPQLLQLAAAEKQNKKRQQATTEEVSVVARGSIEHDYVRVRLLVSFKNKPINFLGKSFRL